MCKYLINTKLLFHLFKNVIFIRPESLVDLISVLNGLVDNRGKIAIPGIYDDVLPLTDEERKLYETIDFSQVFFFYHEKFQEFIFKVYF